MPTWAKVILIAVLVLVLCAAGVVGFGVYMWRQHGPQLIESSKRTMDEGGEYGGTTDNQGCVNEAVARHRKSEGFGDLIKTNLFLSACLDTSRPTPAFCDEVPKRMEFIKGAQWQMEQCQHYGLSTEKQCGQLFQRVQQFCERRPAEEQP
ncbi:MAG: hypothetical protein WCD76_10325 [Pyrinomonadaceae bacterium]